MSKKPMLTYRDIEVSLGDTDKNGNIPVYYGGYKVGYLISVEDEATADTRWVCSESKSPESLSSFETPLEAIKIYLDFKHDNMKIFYED